MRDAVSFKTSVLQIRLLTYIHELKFANSVTTKRDDAQQNNCHRTQYDHLKLNCDTAITAPATINYNASLQLIKKHCSAAPLNTERT